MNTDILLKSEPSVEQFKNIVLVSLGITNSPGGYPKYIKAISKALKLFPPAYCNKSYLTTYNEAAESGEWVATSLITNAEREGDGATRLWSLSACSKIDREKHLLKRHAIDESGHSKAYLKLLDLTFPGSVSPIFREELNQLSPGYSSNQEPLALEGSPYAREPNIDDYIQMNIAEVRTTIHHIMQRSSLRKYCPTENFSSVFKINEALMKDELTHVSYTAKLIEEKAELLEEQEFQDLFAERINDFNKITQEELKDRIFD